MTPAELARLMYDHLDSRADGDYVGEFQRQTFGDGRLTCLDGDFDLEALARVVLDALVPKLSDVSGDNA